MASIRKQRDTYEIRECRSTDRGPRQYTLARFEKVPTPEVLDEGAVRARRPFDPQVVVRAARARGIALISHRTHATARRLLGELRAASRVARSRGPRRDPPVQPFPRFSSGEPAFPAQ